MKYIFSLLILSFTLLNAGNFRVGINTMNIQDSEGGAIALFYQINEDILLETSYVTAYIRGVKKDSVYKTESWNEFNTQRFGIRYNLKSYSQDEIKLFVSAGLEYIYLNKELSSNTPPLNSYGLLGLDFEINQYIHISFAFGSGGKGETADKLETSPNYVHGFNSVIGIELTY